VRALAGDSTITKGFPLPDRTFLPFELLVVTDFVLFFVFLVAAGFFFADLAGRMAGFSKPSCAGVSPMRNSLVPQTAQMPLVMAAPRLVNPGCAWSISLFSLHLKQ